MRQLRAYFAAGAVILMAGGLSLYTEHGRRVVHPKTFVHLMDRRCRGGCTGSAPLYSLAGPFGSAQGVTVPQVGASFCLTATLTAQADWATASTLGILQLGSTFAGNSSASLYRLSNASTSVLIFKVFNSTGVTYELDGVGPVQYPTEVLHNQSHLVAACLSNGTQSLWQDGLQIGTQAGLTSLGTFSTTMRIGDLGSGSFTYGAGISNACIGAPTASASASPTLAVSNGCSQFSGYNAAPVFGGVTPNANATKIYALGDSITEQGASTPRPWPAKLNALLGVTYAVTNAGLSGDIVAGMKARYDATARNWARCTFLGGINDIFGATGASGATTFTNASLLLDEMRSDGCRPIVVLPTPANLTTIGWTSAKQTQYDAYRTSLSGYCTTNAATTTCVDTYGAGPGAGMGDGATPRGLYSAFDSGDHTHPTQAGEDEIAALVFAGATFP